MTQTVLSDVKIPAEKKKRHSPAVHNGIYYVKSSRTIMMINLALHLFAAPFMQIMMMLELSSGGNVDDVGDLVIAAGVLCTFAGVCSGLFTATSVFRSMYDRQHMDMEFSMPMSSKQRFLSDHLSGMFVYIAPYLAAQVISLILWGIGALRFEGKMVGSGVYREICTFYSEYFPYLLMLIAGGFLIMVMVYVLWVLAVVCCGRMFEVVVYGLAANVVPPAMIGIVYATLIGNLYGVDYSRTVERIFMVTSPVGAVFGLLMSMDDGSLFGSSEQCFRGFWEWALLVLIVTAALFALSYFLYVKRTAEKTGQTFAYRLFYNIILGSVTFGIWAVAMSIMIPESDREYNNTVSIFITTLIISFVVFMLLEYFSNKGFGRFGKSVIKFAGFVAGSCVLFVVSVKTGFFGAQYYVPSAAAVTEIQLEYSGLYGDNFRSTYTLRDRDNINAVISAHSNEVQYLKKTAGRIGLSESLNVYYFHEDDSKSDEVVITYVLAGGRTVKRNYRLYASSLMELAKVDTSDEYKQQYIKYITEQLENMCKPADVARIRNASSNEYASDVYRITVYDRFEFLGGENTYSRLVLPEDFGSRLAENLALDINAMTAEEYLYPEKPEYAVLNIPIYTVRKNGYPNFENNLSIVVRGCYSHTVEYLESIHIMLFYDDVAYSYIRQYAWGNSSGPFWIDSEYPASAIPANYTFVYNKTDVSNTNQTGLLDEIINNSIRDHIIDKNCYTITVGYTTGYIPERYADKAEELLRRSDPSQVIYEDHDNSLPY